MRIVVAPRPVPGLEAALAAAGADVVAPADADAIVWSAPAAADELAAILRPQHRWVALPITGIERWLQTGLIDDSRTWTCARGVYAAGVAEHGLALILAGARRLPECARSTTWRSLPGERLRGATVTVLGAGAIGRRLAALLAPTGAHLVALTRSGAAVPGFAESLPASELAAVLPRTRFLVLAAPLTPDTRGVIDGRTLDALGPDGALVNLSRGELVDTGALVERLRSGGLGAALLDVTDPEPLPDGHPLWTLENTLITPHVANPNHGAPWDSHLPELIEHLVANARAFAAGRPLDGAIDVAAGY